MRIFQALIFLLFVSVTSIAQPVNDECENAIDLGMTPFCDTSVLYNNINATASDIGMGKLPPCFKGGVADHDIWFTFTTRDAIEYVFTIQGKPDSTINDTFGLFNPEVAFYSGTCDTSELMLLPICFSAPNQVNSLNFTLDTSDLMSNTTYFIRLNASGVGGINNGSFYMCIEEVDDKFRIDEEGSDLCSGRVYDTGGPMDDYGNNEEYIFTICPDDAHQCITLTMGNYELSGDPAFSDLFKIYDGSDTTGALIGASFDMRDTTGKSMASDVNNAVCQTFFASSGCMTIYWRTDSAKVAAGFDATWSCSQDTCPQFDSLNVDAGADDQNIVDAIQGRLIEISVGETNCVDSAFGTFTGADSDLGLDKGLLVTTGSAAAVGRPNTQPDMGFRNQTPGIPLLDSLSRAVYQDSTTTHDGCSVDLEFTPETDVIGLEITMGSEEYPECLDEQLTDIMGLFYTTAGFMGDPRLDNHVNIARIPGDSLDIQISTINPADSNRWVYYRNMLNSQSVEYDGMVANGSGGQKFIMLTQNVEPCQVNNLITAIADRGDSLYDSGIFLSNIRCLTPVISFQSSTGLPFFIEECDPGEDFITISYPRTYDEDTEWTVRFEGDASEGSDFEWPSGGTIIQPAGEMSVQYPIDVINDGIEEGSERFTIKLFRNWGCGEVELSELEVEIRDRLIAEIRTEGDFCKGDSLILIAEGDLSYLNMQWSPEDLFDDPNLNRQSLLLDDDVMLTLTGTIIGTAGCQWQDSIDIDVIDPQVSINALDPTGICRGESVRLEAFDNVSGTNLIWSPDQNISSTTDRSVVVTPDRTTSYVVTVDTANCEDTARIVIDVEELAFPNVINDTTICAGESIVLADLRNPNNQSIYQWSPGAELDDPTSPTPVARPTDTTTYFLSARTTRGYCTDSARVTVNVIDVGIDIIASEDTLYICLGDTLDLSVQTRGQGSISWSPGNGIIGPNDEEDVQLSPEITTTYTVTYTNDRCSPQDQITVVVDRLPENGLQLTPDNPPFCVGDTINISVDYGNVTPRDPGYVWSPGGPIIEGQGTESILAVPLNSVTFRLNLVNGACEEMYEIEIPVVEYEPDGRADTVVCFGDTITLDPVLVSGFPDSLVSYLWETRNSNDEIEILDPSDPNTKVVVRRGGTVDYLVTIGACEFINTVRLENSRPGDVNWILEPDSVANCAEVTATLEYTGMPTSEILTETIEWTYTDTLGNSTNLDGQELTVTHTPNTSGTFRIRFTDSNGCPHSETIQMTVVEPIREMIPNAFTPNGDGMNDVYRIKFVDDIEYEVESFRVFNRWGQLVYEANNNTGWDGRMTDGSEALSEVYLVVIEFVDACGNPVEQITRDVTLIR